MPSDHGSGLHPFKGKVSSRIHDHLSPNRHRSRSASDEPYLSYYDIRLTQEDVDSLKDDWLTDNVLAFWQEYLEHEVLSKHKRINVVLLRPTMAFMLMQTPDPTSLQGALPDLSTATHIFLPINNNTDTEHAEGGTHWSLLLVSISDSVAFHYDSLYPANEDDGELAANKLSQFLGLKRPLRYVNLDGTPQQANSSDCGVFVCLLTKYLLDEKLLRKHVGQQVDMSVNSKALQAQRGRKMLRETIDECREEGLRRQRSSSNRSRSRSTSPPRIGPETAS